MAVPNNPDDLIIETRGMAKHFGNVRAVDGIDLTNSPGEIYGFFGRNEAGKTITIRMMLGLIRQTVGDVRILGTSIQPGAQSVFARVGFWWKGPPPTRTGPCAKTSIFNAGSLVSWPKRSPMSSLCSILASMKIAGRARCR